MEIDNLDITADPLGKGWGLGRCRDIIPQLQILPILNILMFVTVEAIP